MFLGALWTARRPPSAQARVFRRRVAAVGLFIVVMAGGAFALLSTPVDDGTARGRSATGADAEGEGGVDIATERRFSSGRLPALSLDAPEGWKLNLDTTGR